MKQYTRPTATVVELAVKENIAALPAAIGGGVVTKTAISESSNLILTTYNLATQATSNVAGA